MKTILLIDDDKDFLYATSELLTNRNYTVHCASSFNEALNLLDTYAIEIMIADIIIPEHDGFELIMLVRKLYPNIKIIAISGGGKIDKETYLKMAKGMTADATLAKPFRIDDLVITILQLS
jgi:CheY-like chemotaxis protein